MSTALAGRRRTGRGRSMGWAIIGVLGELLITLGILLLLFVVYQVWWTTVEAERAADRAAATLQDAWQRPPAGSGTASPASIVVPELGDAFALMYIPRLRTKVWGVPVVEGVAAEQLAQGIGHYPDSALPGDVGNFAVAAHRATNGEPFRDVDRLRTGDQVYVETRDEWFVYALQRDQIVPPNAVWVLDAVPGDAQATPTEALVTLTTCHPRWASDERWVWWGRLVDTIDKGSGAPPPEILAGA